MFSLETFLKGKHAITRNGKHVELIHYGPERLDAYPLLVQVEGILGMMSYRDNGMYLKGDQVSEWDLISSEEAICKKDTKDSVEIVLPLSPGELLV